MHFFCIIARDKSQAGTDIEMPGTRRDSCATRSNLAIECELTIVETSCVGLPICAL